MTIGILFYWNCSFSLYVFYLSKCVYLCIFFFFVFLLSISLNDTLDSIIMNELPGIDRFTFTYSRFAFADSNNNYDSATLRVRGCRMCAVREWSTVKRERYIYILWT